MTQGTNNDYDYDDDHEHEHEHEQREERLRVKGCFRVAFTAMGLLLIAVALGAITLMFETDIYAKGLIERTLSYVINADLRVEHIRVLPLEPGLELRGISVSNPGTFKSGTAMTIKRALLRFDPKTLFSKTPVIRQVLLQGMHVNLRYEIGEGTNLGTLRKQAKLGSHPEDAKAPRAARGAFIVQEVRCEEAEMALSTNMVPVVKADLHLAPFTLHDFGNRPVTVGELTAAFLGSVLRETLTLRGLLSPVTSLLQKESDDTP